MSDTKSYPPSSTTASYKSLRLMKWVLTFGTGSNTSDVLENGVSIVLHLDKDSSCAPSLLVKFGKLLYEFVVLRGVFDVGLRLREFESFRRHFVLRMNARICATLRQIDTRFNASKEWTLSGASRMRQIQRPRAGVAIVVASFPL